jgi:hypothetical protein
MQLSHSQSSHLCLLSLGSHSWLELQFLEPSLGCLLSTYFSHIQACPLRSLMTEAGWTGKKWMSVSPVHVDQSWRKELHPRPVERTGPGGAWAGVTAIMLGFVGASG